MQPLRYSINFTLDGCVDHRAGVPDEEMHRHHARNIEQADALARFPLEPLYRLCQIPS
jgi:hypothetical protein